MVVVVGVVVVVVVVVVVGVVVVGVVGGSGHLIVSSVTNLCYT